MHTKLMARAKRSRPISRANYGIDKDIREILINMAERQGRSESSQVERLVLQAEAIARLITRNEEISFQSLEKEINDLWQQIVESSDS